MGAVNIGGNEPLRELTGQETHPMLLEKGHVKEMDHKLCVFKVGLTSSPIVRFEFYKDANYTHMSLLHVSENLGAAQMLEAALIALHISEKGCRNERYGGEGPPCSHGEKFHYVYVVGARADQLKPIR